MLQPIDQSHLSALDNELATLRADLARVTAQRDRLRDALQSAHDLLMADHASPSTPEGRRAVKAVNNARAALAACRD